MPELSLLPLLIRSTVNNTQFVGHSLPDVSRTSFRKLSIVFLCFVLLFINVYGGFLPISLTCSVFDVSWFV